MWIRTHSVSSWIYKHTCMWTHIQVGMHSYACRHAHTCIYACICTCMKALPHTLIMTLFPLPFTYTFSFAPIFSFPLSSSTFPILRPSWYSSELLWIWYLWWQDLDLLIHKVNEQSCTQNVDVFITWLSRGNIKSLKLNLQEAKGHLGLLTQAACVVISEGHGIEHFTKLFLHPQRYNHV